VQRQAGTQPRVGEDAQPGDNPAIAEVTVEEPERREDRERAAEHRPRRPGGDHPDRGRADRRQDRPGARLEHHDRCITERDLRDGGRVTPPEAAQQSDPGRHRGLPLQGAGEEGAGVRGMDSAALQPLAPGGTEHGAPRPGPQRQGQEVRPDRRREHPWENRGERREQRLAPRRDEVRAEAVPTWAPVIARRLTGRCRCRSFCRTPPG
jgi:hypothetical protein